MSAGLQRRLQIGAPMNVVSRALTSLAGIRSWWTPLADGSTAAGGTFRLRFEGLDEKMDFHVEAAGLDAVRWTCVRHTSLPEWDGTTVDFALRSPRSQICALRFRHDGLTPTLACYPDCRAGWDHFLRSLASFCETGRGAPYGSPSPAG